ncbi:MAG: hypothetical protein WD826_08595 [Actinomycetota bacterium]
MALRLLGRVLVRSIVVALLAVLSFAGMSGAFARIADDSAGTAEPVDTEVNTLPVPEVEGAAIEPVVVQNSPAQVVEESTVNIPATSATSRGCADGSGSRSQLNLLQNSRVPGYCG